MTARKPVQIPHSVADVASSTRAVQGAPVGSDITHQKQRQKLRKKLVGLGLPDEFISRRIEALKLRQRAERDGDDTEARRLGDVERELIHEQTYLLTRLDDSKHKPTQVDSVLRGTARATGQTAKAVKARKTITKYQHDRNEAAS